MARRYDTRTTIFSPEGRLYQVEYAMEAVGHAGTCLGMVTKDGIIVAAERRSHNKLLDESIFSEKIYKVNDDISCAVAGITSDANVLLDQMRLNSQRHYILYQDQIPVEQLVTQVCDVLHSYTMYGGRRPFGVSMLFIGWDKEFGYQLYQSDPSGNFVGWKATCIGSNSAAACSMLEQEFDSEKLDVQSGLKLCVKILYKSMTMSKLTADKIELAVMKRKEDKTYVNLCPQSEIETLIKEVEQADMKEKQTVDITKEMATSSSEIMDKSIDHKEVETLETDLKAIKLVENANPVDKSNEKKEHRDHIVEKQILDFVLVEYTRYSDEYKSFLDDFDSELNFQHLSDEDNRDKNETVRRFLRFTIITPAKKIIEMQSENVDARNGVRGKNNRDWISEIKNKYNTRMKARINIKDGYKYEKAIDRLNDLMME